MTDAAGNTDVAAALAQRAPPGARIGSQPMIRPAASQETPALVALGASTGLFTPQEADVLLRQVLDDLHAGRLGEGHQAHVWTDAAGHPAGWVYFSPDPHADGVWELWWIGVAPNRQRTGVGAELMSFVEARVRAEGGRVLMVATSSLPALEPTRRFYMRRGYHACGRVPDYYANGDDKVIFAVDAEYLASRP